MAFCTNLLFLLVAGIAPSGSLADSQRTRKKVDLIEHHHFVDKNGREVFQQVIFYDWSAANRRFHVRAWRLIKSDDQIPIRQFDPPRYECSWNDEGCQRLVTAPQMKETWTQQDPERLNRAFWPEERRVPLWEAPTSP
ncbi:hypothetical protein Q31b_10720 [Novipirellula aureliae]|uniref:Uncharacterized protein n=1 Tax=Novipirellula aureliae TaxID=2527966 RepID=A0A5C6EEC7_9BACT|nr:hypothetical protein [Novipirellula aureliae]TWU45896.1 hypothetical protein Q31b_10720 [Novipirellula aureliae]